MLGGFFGWFRNRVKDEFLAGCNDAVDELEGAKPADPGNGVTSLRGRVLAIAGRASGRDPEDDEEDDEDDDEFDKKPKRRKSRAAAVAAK